MSGPAAVQLALMENPSKTRRSITCVFAAEPAGGDDTESRAGTFGPQRVSDWTRSNTKRQRAGVFVQKVENLQQPECIATHRTNKHSCELGGAWFQLRSEDPTVCVCGCTLTKYGTTEVRLTLRNMRERKKFHIVCLHHKQWSDTKTEQFWCFYFELSQFLKCVYQLIYWSLLYRSSNIWTVFTHKTIFTHSNIEFEVSFSTEPGSERSCMTTSSQ